MATRHIKTLYIQPASPWQNGHVESFHGSLRDECLDRELMLSVAEARVVSEDYRRYYNEVRPHGGIGYRTPAQACHEAQALDVIRQRSYSQGLDPVPKLIPVPRNPASHSFRTKLEDSIKSQKPILNGSRDSPSRRTGQPLRASSLLGGLRRRDIGDSQRQHQQKWICCR